MKDNDYLDKSERDKLEFLLNVKVSNNLFMAIDTLRAEYLIQNKSLPSRSEIIRMLLEEGLKSFHIEDSV